MNRNKAVSFILLFSMLVSLLTGSVMTAYGAEASGGDDITFGRSAYQSDGAEGLTEGEALGTVLELEEGYSLQLKLQEDQTNYMPGAFVTLDVLAEWKGSAAPIELLDQDIFFNTEVFEYVSSVSLVKSEISGNYIYEGESPLEGRQRIKILYSSQLAGGTQKNPVKIATLNLCVREEAALGKYAITQEIKGLAAAGQIVESDVLAESLSITVGSGETYKLTVASENEDMGKALGGGAFTEGSEVVISAIPERGYQFKEWVSEGGGKVERPLSAATTFTMPGNAATVTAIFVEAKDPTVRLKPEQEKSSWNRGDTIVFNLQVERNGSEEQVGMLDYDLEFDTSAFKLVTCSGIQGSVISGDYTYEEESRPDNRQRVKVLYSNQFGAGSQDDPLSVARIELQVKGTAAAKQYVLEQAVKGLSIGTQNLTTNTFVVPTAITVQSASTGVTVSGYIGALPGVNGGTAVEGVKGATVVFGEGLEGETDASGYFSIDGVASGNYEVQVKGTGIVTRTLSVAIDGSNLELGTQESMVGVLRGDFNGDDDINLTDLTEFMKTYNKNNTMEGFNPIGDYNYNDDISLEDLTVFMQHYQKSKDYYNSWSY